MSFIRCLSNPDGAYVIGSALSGLIEFYTTDFKPFYVPPRSFYGLIKKFLKDGEPCKYGKFSIKESDDFKKYILTYEDVSISLWQVTWWYIVHNAEWRFLSDKERIRRLNLRDKY